jgi:hypothetical protein
MWQFGSALKRLIDSKRWRPVRQLVTSRTKHEGSIVAMTLLCVEPSMKSRGIGSADCEPPCGIVDAWIRQGALVLLATTQLGLMHQKWPCHAAAALMTRMTSGSREFGFRKIGLLSEDDHQVLGMPF